MAANRFEFMRVHLRNGTMTQLRVKLPFFNKVLSIYRYSPSYETVCWASFNRPEERLPIGHYELKLIPILEMYNGRI